MTARDAPRLLLGEPEGMPRRQLVRQRRLVDGGGIDQVRRERDLGQKVETARRGRGENEALAEVVSGQLSVLGSRLIGARPCTARHELTTDN
jgi:hypothetical protein